MTLWKQLDLVVICQGKHRGRHTGKALTTVARNRARATYPSLLVAGNTQIDGLLDVPQVKRALGKLAGEGERGLAHKGGLLVDEGVEGRRTGPSRVGRRIHSRRRTACVLCSAALVNSPTQPLISPHRQFA